MEALKVVASLVAEDMGEEILREDVSDVEFSERHKKNMKEFFEKLHREAEENEKKLEN